MAFLLFLTWIWSQMAFGNVGEAYGLGSRAASLAGAAVAGGSGELMAYTNPADAPLTENRLLFSFGFLDMTPRFKSIENVVVENQFTSDRLRTGHVDTDYRDTVGQFIGLSYLVAPSFYRFAVGASFFLPLNQLVTIDSGDAFLPEYVYYRTRTQRPQLNFSFSIEPIEQFRIGAGLHLAYSLSANAAVLMQTDPTKPSSMRFAASLKPRPAPVFGVLWKRNKLSLGSVIRFPIRSSYFLILNAGARALGNLPVLDFNFQGFSALFDDPLTVEVGTTIEYLPRARLYLQADYQTWKNFSTPAITIQKPETGSGGVAFSPDQNPRFEFQNIWVLRAGHELTWDSFAVRLGYAYRPSMLKSTSTGAGNYLDPPKHIYTGGWGFKFSKFLNYQIPCSLDFHAAYHDLITQKINKTPGDETGAGGDLTKIGSPSYEAGGNIIGGGVSFLLEI